MHWLKQLDIAAWSLADRPLEGALLHGPCWRPLGRTQLLVIGLEPARIEGRPWEQIPGLQPWPTVR